MKITAQSNWVLTLRNNLPILQRRIKTNDFSHGAGIIKSVIDIANKMNHHPDSIVLESDHIIITLTTHDSKAVTKKDEDLASEIDKLVSL